MYHGGIMDLAVVQRWLNDVTRTVEQWLAGTVQPATSEAVAEGLWLA